MDAETLIVERAYEDFEEGVRQAFRILRERHSRIAAASLEALVNGAMATMDLRARMRDEVRELLALARRANAGEDPRALAAEHLPVLLKRKHAHMVLRESDPQYAPLHDMTLDLFAARLPDLARMAAVQDAADYPELVRRAFPEKDHVVAFVHDNRARILAIVAHLEAHPHLLRMPSGLLPRLAGSAREMVEWKTQDVLAAVEEIYDFDPPV